MKASRLRGMSVVSIAEAEKVGTVHDLYVNPNARRLVALSIKASDGTLKSVPVGAVNKVGRDAITIKDAKSLREEVPEKGDSIVPLSKLMGTRAVTHGGDVLGSVSEVEFDPSDFHVESYDLSTGVLSTITGSRKTLPADEHVHYGKELLMVTEEAAAGVEGEEKGGAPRGGKTGTRRH